MSNLEDEIAHKMSMQMQREVDREVLWGMLKELGWIRVMLSTAQDNEHAIDITFWLEENCKGAYERHGRDFIFELEKDAVTFILRWT